MTATSDAARALGRRRMAGMTEAERKNHQSNAASSYWAKLSPAERSAEMKRRAKKRKKSSHVR